MDLNSLMESATALWSVIGVAGGLTIINILTFVKTSVSGKKFKNVSDFAVVADQSIKFAKNEIKELKTQIVEETSKAIVEPLKQQITALVSDNAKLTSTVVFLISLIPLPLEVKKDTVAVIGTLGNITKEAKALLDTSIAYQESQAVIEQEQNTEIQNNINDI